MNLTKRVCDFFFPTIILKKKKKKYTGNVLLPNEPLRNLKAHFSNSFIVRSFFTVDSELINTVPYKLLKKKKIFSGPCFICSEILLSRTKILKAYIISKTILQEYDPFTTTIQLHNFVTK